MDVNIIKLPAIAIIIAIYFGWSVLYLYINTPLTNNTIPIAGAKIGNNKLKIKLKKINRPKANIRPYFP